MSGSISVNCFIWLTCCYLNRIVFQCWIQTGILMDYKYLYLILSFRYTIYYITILYITEEEATVFIWRPDVKKIEGKHPHWLWRCHKEKSTVTSSKKNVWTLRFSVGWLVQVPKQISRNKLPRAQLSQNLPMISACTSVVLWGLQHMWKAKCFPHRKTRIMWLDGLRGDTALESPGS